MARIEVDERDEELALTAELPGTDHDQIRVEAKNGVLTIRGERREERSEEQGGRYQRYTSFYRQVPLSPDVDLNKAQASFKHGFYNFAFPARTQASG